MSDKIVKFPDKKMEAIFPTSVEESIDHVAQIRKEYCDEVGSDAFDAVLSVVNNYGLTLRTNQVFIKDAVFLEEAIKAFIYRIKKLEHPFHEIAESTITISDELRSEIEERLNDNYTN